MLDNVGGKGKIIVVTWYYLEPKRGYHRVLRRFPLIFSIKLEKFQNQSRSLDSNLTLLQIAASLLPAPSMAWMQAYQVCEGLGSLDGENSTLKDLSFPTLLDNWEDWLVEDTRDVEVISHGPAHHKCKGECVVKARMAHAKMLKENPSKGLVL